MVSHGERDRLALSLTTQELFYPTGGFCPPRWRLFRVGNNSISHSPSGQNHISSFSWLTPTRRALLPQFNLQILVRMTHFGPWLRFSTWFRMPISAFHPPTHPSDVEPHGAVKSLLQQGWKWEKNLLHVVADCWLLHNMSLLAFWLVNSKDCFLHHSIPTCKPSWASTWWMPVAF